MTLEPGRTYADWNSMTFFKPAPSAAPAQWVLDGFQGFAKSVLSVVPSGFDAYARLFHPARRVTHTTQTPVRWTEVARQTNRIPHRQMQWPGIRGDAPGSGSKPEPDASWLEPPEEGSLPAALARPLWQHLERHTQAPERCATSVFGMASAALVRRRRRFPRSPRGSAAGISSMRR